jgi:hypothetical protein
MPGYRAENARTHPSYESAVFAPRAIVLLCPISEQIERLAAGHQRLNFE